jgi:cytochrome c553
MKKFILAGLVLVAVGVVGAFLFAWSGLYSVAASRGHFPFMSWFLEFGMRNSVETHAWSIDPPLLDDPALHERGPGHFHLGCAPCHGAPGLPSNPITEGMLPEPPDLSRSALEWEPKHLFWIVKHGLKYTGMPAWPAQEREDEVWALVAFLEKLPQMDAAEYRSLVGLDPATMRVSEAGGLFETDAASCALCHGPNGEGSENGGIPRLAGQKSEYLAMTLADYASGSRPSGIMEPIAAYLDEAERERIAEHYASLDPAPPESEAVQDILPADLEFMQMGGALAAVGDPELGIAACESCHGEDTDPRYPRLDGLHPAYLEQQLKLWREGIRGGTYADIMSAAVQNITDEQIRAVALYYARKNPDAQF